MAKLQNGHGGWVDTHDRQTDLDLQILDLLREGPKSAYRLAAALTRLGEVLGTDAVRERLKALASRGLVVGTASDLAKILTAYRRNNRGRKTRPKTLPVGS